MTNTASPIRMVKSRTVSRNVSASPCRLARIVGGTISASALLIKLVASPMATSGFKLKKIVDAGELIQMIYRLRPKRTRPVDQRVKRDKIFSVIGPDIEQREVIGLRALRNPGLPESPDTGLPAS